MKKTLSVILSLVMAFTAICAVAALPSFAADGNGYKNKYRDRATWSSPFYGRWSFNAGPITAYVEKSEIDKFAGEGGIGAYSSRPKELPVVYLLIKHFGISKEQFTTAVRNGAKDYLLLYCLQGFLMYQVFCFQSQIQPKTPVYSFINFFPSVLMSLL